MKVSVLDSPVPVGRRPQVCSLRYDLDSLVIDFDPDADGAQLAITFESPRGFRCLDEGDLTRYWAHSELVDNWLFRIDEGGWLTDEAKGHLEISVAFGYQEYLICGVDDCVTVLANAPPTVEVVNPPNKPMQTDRPSPTADRPNR